MKKSFIVDDEFNEMRLDRWIRNHLGKIPQGLIEKNLRNGIIKVNKRKVKSSYKIKTNDEINLSGGKKPMKVLKNNILRGCNVRIDNNNKIIEIKSSNEYSSKGTAFKNLILKYQYSLNKNIVKHFNLPESLFINK